MTRARPPLPGALVPDRRPRPDSALPGTLAAPIWLGVMLGCALSGCSSFPAPPSPTERLSTGPWSGSLWGPLSVASRDAGLDALATGTLRIEDSCVTVERGDAVWLLVWPPERTSWLPVTNQIRFHNLDGGVVDVKANQQVMVTGGGDPGGPVTWIAPPAAACTSLDRWWVVDVDVADQSRNGEMRITVDRSGKRAPADRRSVAVLWRASADVRHSSLSSISMNGPRTGWARHDGSV